MAGRQYYTLVAGLTQLAPDSTGFDVEKVRQEVLDALSARDRRTAELLLSLADPVGLSREEVSLLYRSCLRSRSRYLREWALFDLNLRNAIASRIARTKGWEFVPVTGSVDEEPQQEENLEADYLNILNTAMERASILEKERDIDTIRWRKAEELAGFDVFGMPTLLSYLVRLGIVGRWAALDPETGREMYLKLVNNYELRITNYESKGDE